MAYWTSKGMGVLFGGVSDQEVDDERMSSVFYNDMYGLRTDGQGRWISLPLKKAKKQTGSKKQRGQAAQQHRHDHDSDEWSSHVSSFSIDRRYCVADIK